MILINFHEDHWIAKKKKKIKFCAQKQVIGRIFLTEIPVSNAPSYKTLHYAEFGADS